MVPWDCHSHRTIGAVVEVLDPVMMAEDPWDVEARVRAEDGPGMVPYGVEHPIGCSLT